MTSIKKTLKKWLAVSEIEQSSVLQAFYWVLLFGFYISFHEWVSTDYISPFKASQGREICPSYLPHCSQFYFLEGLPLSYALTGWYAILAGTLILGAIYAWKKQWLEAILILIPALIWKLLMALVLSFQVIVQFEYFHIPYVIIFLFAHRKLYFLRNTVVLLYLLSAAVKISDTWIVGNYFSSLSLGMPFVPRFAIPFMSNGVIALEIFGAWLLLSPNRKVRLSAVILWILFHLYSIVLVGYDYPAYCVPILLVLFLPTIPQETLELSWRELTGWAVMGWLGVVSAIPHFIAGNKQYTLQQDRLGLGMFDANHQCISQVTFHFKDGTSHVEEQIKSRRAMRRCGPYPSWYLLHRRCELNSSIERVEWRVISSANGGPFYKIIDVPNACAVDFKTFEANSWIVSPEDGAPIVGYPRPNYYNGDDPNPNEPIVYDTPMDTISSSQRFFALHESVMEAFWKILWLGGFLFFCGRAIKHRFLRDHPT